jgi:hypothetical protein
LQNKILIRQLLKKNIRPTKWRKTVKGADAMKLLQLVMLGGFAQFKDLSDLIVRSNGKEDIR